MNFSVLQGKFTSLLMATLGNVFSTWGNSRVQLFLSTRWCISLSLVAFGHSWYGEMHQRVLRKSWTLELPHVEKLHSISSKKIVKLMRVKSGRVRTVWVRVQNLSFCLKINWKLIAKITGLKLIIKSLKLFISTVAWPTMKFNCYCTGVRSLKRLGGSTNGNI